MLASNPGDREVGRVTVAASEQREERDIIALQPVLKA